MFMINVLLSFERILNILVKKTIFIRDTIRVALHIFIKAKKKLQVDNLQMWIV